MSHKTRNIIIILLAVAVITLVVWYFVAKQKDNQPVIVEEPMAKTSQQVKKDKTENQIVDNLEKKVAGKSQEEISLEAKILGSARFFIERYGSFSSQADWQNLKDLEPFVTDSMYQGFENVMNRAQTGEKYYSLSTKVLSAKINDFADGEAWVLANTQKQENNNGQESVFYQEIEVKLISVGDDWLVDDVEIGVKKENK